MLLGAEPNRGLFGALLPLLLLGGKDAQGDAAATPACSTAAARLTAAAAVVGLGLLRPSDQAAPRLLVLTLPLAVGIAWLLEATALTVDPGTAAPPLLFAFFPKGLGLHEGAGC